jgi:hypothetical protein
MSPPMPMPIASANAPPNPMASFAFCTVLQSAICNLHGYDSNGTFLNLRALGCQALVIRRHRSEAQPRPTPTSAPRSANLWRVPVAFTSSHLLVHNPRPTALPYSTTLACMPPPSPRPYPRSQELACLLASSLLLLLTQLFPARPRFLRCWLP